jgi:serine/threonine protein kinase
VEERDCNQSDARRLAEMMAFGRGDVGLWKPQELAALLRHQLDAPLAFDFGTLDPALGQQAEGIGCGEEPPILTFRDLLHHPRPPVALLELTKRFAKSCSGRPDAALPEEVATVLYTLSIVAGMMRCGSRITELDDRQLRERLDWALSQPWIDPSTRRLLDEGRRWLDTAADQSPAVATRGAGFVVPPKGGTTNGPPPEMSMVNVPLGQLGEYSLLEKLGEGGMGTVYKALHTELDRLVAIKVMRKGYVEEDGAVARFRREIKAVGQLDHPNIVRAHDARKIADTHFLVMEYVDGLDLNELVDRLGPLSTADACELTRQAALGLQCAHEHGLVHRDVKPSNLMLNRQGQLKILDLGLVRVRAVGESNGEMTVAGQVMGTPDYMAPEQISDSRTTDIRADLYSLGCTLYRLLTGHAPFSGPEYQSLLAKMTAQSQQTPPPAGQLRGDVPPELDAVLARMLAKSPEQRYATPGEVAEALASLSQGSDLRALLARAESMPKGSAAGQAAFVVPPSGGRDAAVTPVASGKTVPTAASAKSRMSPFSRAVAAALLVVVLGGGLAWLLFGRGEKAKDSGAVAVSTGQGGEAADSTPAQKPASTVPDKATESHKPAPIVRDKEEPEKHAVVPPVAPPETRKTPAVVPVKPSELPGWIVLSWTRPRMGKPNLWLVRPDGKGRVRITHDSRAYDIHPKFSPDGRRIAFIRGGGFGELSNVCVCNADGSGLRWLVVPRDKSEHFASPVWVSNSRIYYARSAKDSLMEIWQVDLDGGAPRLVFSFKDAMGKGEGLVTDVSPNGRLAVIAQSGLASSSDVYVTDLRGKNAETVWADSPGEWKDARALWSPDGAQLAWHHNFTRGLLAKRICYGVGMAERDATGKWKPRLQSEHDTTITPLAWSPRGDFLLCARLHDTRERLPPATLCLMDRQFRTVRVLFELEACPWQPATRDPGRLADWAIVPPDVVIPSEP